MKKLICILILTAFSTLSAWTQRQQHLGRGVVATYHAETGITISWRRLIQDPENASYNVYIKKKGESSFSKLTPKPTTLTNYRVGASQVPDGTEIQVTLVGNDGQESTPSIPFIFNRISLNSTSINNGYLAVNFKDAGSPVYNHDDVVYTTKFCWPTDVDGDGEMDYIVDRHSNKVAFGGTQGESGHCIEAYDSRGKHLWSIDLGPNIFEGSGQNDGVTVGDFDGDGKGEVMVQVSDGCRLWDKANNTWGKYLAYGQNDGTTADTDGDGIVNYTTSATENPQYYMLVVNGEDGSQKGICPMTLPKDHDNTYTRHNKADYYGDEYPYMTAAMGTAYLNGKQQSAVAQFQVRTKDGKHHYYTYAYGYFDENGKNNGELCELFTFAFHDNGNPSEFHGIRIGDVDGDGKDEVLNGCFALDHNGRMLWNAGISHGDRFRLSDIDPDRPGQEIFAIQQNAPDMLGSILYDAANGQAIRKWYLAAVGDVGRGECMDVDAGHKGYEMWSTMPDIYNAKGDVIGNNKPFPYEGIWWDGDLGRESVMTPGSGNNCPIVIAKYDKSSTWKRLNQISKDAGWQLVAENAVRPMFFGDIYGDWREELVLKQLINGEECGFVVLTTNYTTEVDHIYCLLQDPNYFGQTTNRGYYQSPMTGFYLGWDMPRPALPPFIQADAHNQVFDLTLGNSSITPSADAHHIYAMPVKGQTLTLDGYTGEADIWKSQQGTLLINGEINTTGHLIVSEGTLHVNGKVKGNVDLRARGILTGHGTIGGILTEGSLNEAEGVIRPSGTLSIDSDVCIDKNTFIEIDLDKPTLLQINGNLEVSADLIFLINAKKLEEGEYRLVSFTGTFSGDTRHLLTRGITGLSYRIVEKDHAVVLVVNGQRAPAQNVTWTGTEGSDWDYLTENWTLNGQPTTFVAGDRLLFDDSASSTTVSINELMPVAEVEVNASKSFTFQGDGGLSGSCSLVKNGTGTLNLKTVKADYTGATIINGGTVAVWSLADGGSPSSLGAAGSSPSNLQIGKATLSVNNSNTATNRGISLNDTATIHIPSGTCAIKGNISGKGVLRKTGAGQLNITYDGATAYAGTILQSGTLAQGTWKSTFGSATSPIHVTGNATIVQFDANSTSTIPNFQNAVSIDAGKTLTFKASSRGYVRGSLQGKGTFAISLPYVRGDISTDVSGFEGTYNVLSSNCRFVKSMDFSKATLKMEEGAYAAGFTSGKGTEKSYTFAVGAIAGSGSLGTGTWNIGYLGLDDSFAGTFKSGATVNKYGEGTLTLSGTSEAPIQIFAGTVLAANTSAPVTNATITVKEGGSLLGQGQVKNVIVQAGGTIGVQASAINNILLKTLTVNGTLKVNQGDIRIRYRSSSVQTSYDSFCQNGTVTLNSPTFRFVSTNGTDILPDTEFRLFKGEGKIVLEGEVKILPETPLPGYEWDTSTLATDGTIRITQTSGIQTISPEEVGDATIFDLNGRQVERITSPGLYIINNNKVFINKHEEKGY